MSDDFYLRYYQGHHGKWGHEFIEFEFRPDGRASRSLALGLGSGLVLRPLQLRYANNSNYKNDDIITREVFVSQAILDEVKRIVQDSEVVKEDDNQWPEPDRVGRQELEVIVDGKHISFTCTKLGSVLQVQQSKDPEGLRVFYYLVQ
ncbi:hypothetical protein QJQ45_030053, partial [Haematococcus lacustris]